MRTTGSSSACAGDHVVVIDGYEGEPYLRFAPDGRLPQRPLTRHLPQRRPLRQYRTPAAADPKASPDWERVAPAGRAYDWHDHRIHWMSTTYPPVVAADKPPPHHIFGWTVPGTIDGKPPAADHGSLDYKPLPGQRFPLVLVIPLAVLALVAVSLPLLRRRQARGGREEATGLPPGRGNQER